MEGFGDPADRRKNIIMSIENEQKKKHKINVFEAPRYSALHFRMHMAPGP